MEASRKSVEAAGEFPDPELFNNIKATIEEELDKMKKIVNNINEMRVEAAYLESDLLLTIDASTWAAISELIGPAPMKMDDISLKKETE